MQKLTKCTFLIKVLNESNKKKLLNTLTISIIMVKLISKLIKMDENLIFQNVIKTKIYYNKFYVCLHNQFCIVTMILNIIDVYTALSSSTETK
jgi:hypothetical protein